MKTTTHLATISFALACAACSYEYPPAPSPPLAGEVQGLWRGSEVKLALQAGGSSEELTRSADGSFAFGRTLDAGLAYAVAVSAQPTLQTCTVSGGEGTTTEAAAPLVDIRCAPSFGLSITHTLPLEAAFSAETRAYAADVSLLAQSVAFTVACDAPGCTARIDDVATPLGVPTAARPLVPGESSFAVDIVVGEIAQTYQFTFRRGAVPPSQYVYAKASNSAAGLFFAGTIDADGDVMVVGAPGDGANQSGAAYVFRRTGSTWIEEARLKPSSVDSAGCGTAAVVSGSVIAVSCPSENGQAGVVYVFRKVGALWTQEARLEASNAEVEDLFGVTLALDGDNLAVAAPGEDSNGIQTNNSVTDNGAIYVFHWNGTAWTQEAYLKPLNAAPDVACCSGLAVSGPRVAFGYKHNAALEGSVSVYVRGSGGGWGNEQNLVRASNPADARGFGNALALEGDLLAVGATQEGGGSSGVNGSQTDQSKPNSGAVYVFRNNVGWRQEAYIKASNPGDGDAFGYSVAVSGEMLAIGAWDEDSAATGVDGDQQNNDDLSSGAAYVYRRSGTTWIPASYVKASNTDPADTFGYSVTLARDTLAVGTPFERSNATGLNGSQSDNSLAVSGAAYIFR